MDKEKFAKAWAKVCKYFKANDIDLEDTEKSDVSVTLTRSELMSVVQDAVQQVITKGDDDDDGDGAGKGDGGEGGEDGGDGGDDGEGKGGDDGAGDGGDEGAGSGNDKSDSGETGKVLKALVPIFKSLDSTLKESKETNKTVISTLEVLVKNASASTSQKKKDETQKEESLFKGLL